MVCTLKDLRDDVYDPFVEVIIVGEILDVGGRVLKLEPVLTQKSNTNTSETSLPLRKEKSTTIWWKRPDPQQASNGEMAISGSRSVLATVMALYQD